MSINLYKSSKYINKDYFNNIIGGVGNSSWSSASNIDMSKVLVKNSSKTKYVLDLPFCSSSGNNIIESDNQGKVYLPNISNNTGVKYLYYNPTTGEISYDDFDFAAEQNVHITGDLTVDEGISTTSLTLSSNLQANGGVYLDGISEASTNKLLFYDIATGTVSYNDIPAPEFAPEQNVHITGDLTVDEGINTTTGTFTNNVEVQGVFTLPNILETSTNKLLFYNPTTDTVSYGDIPPAEFAAEQNVHITGDLTVDEGISTTSVLLSNDLQANGNVVFGGITESTKPKVLYFDTTSDIVYYGDVPTGYWNYSSGDIDYYTGAVKVNNLNVDDVIDFTSGLNTISYNAIQFGDNGTINATTSELQNILCENKLEVYTNQFYVKYIDSATTSQMLYWNSTTGKITYGNVPSAGSSFWTQTGSELYYTDSGTPKVFIQTSATSSQDAILEIRGARTSSTTGDIAQIIFATNDNESGSDELACITARKQDANTNTGNLLFWTTATDGGTPYERMRIDKYGNIGIGATSPSSLLHIKSSVTASAQTTGLLIENTAASATGEAAVCIKTTDTGSNYWFAGTNQSNRYEIGYGTAFTNGVTWLTINTTGEVGIKDITPSYTLDVNGDIRAQNYLYVGTGGGYFYNDSGSRVRINQDFYTNNSNTYLYASNLYLGAASSQNIRVRANDLYGDLWHIYPNGNAIFGVQNTANEATIHLDITNGGSPQIAFSDYNDCTWVIGADDGDNSFKIHGVTDPTIPTINNLTSPYFELTSSGSLIITDNISSNSVTIDGIELKDSTDRSGLLEINRLGTSSYSGIQIDHSSTAKWSLMGHETTFGLYDDANSDWILQYTENAGSILYYNNTQRLATASSGVNITGNLSCYGDIQPTGGTYKSANGTSGITTTLTFIDNDSITRTIVIKNGIVTSAS